MEYLQGQVFEIYSSHNLKRLLGLRPEKESSKAVVDLIYPYLRSNSRILEIGCSSGHLLRTLNKKNLSLNYTGVDIDKYAISKGNEAISKLSLPGINSAELIEVSGTKLPFAPNEFDVVISLNVLEHLNEPRYAIEEILRCAKSFIAIRTLVSDQTFIVKEVRNSHHDYLGYEHLDLPKPKDELDEFGNPKVFIYQNVYNKTFIGEILNEHKEIKKWEIFEDNLFDAKAFDLDNQK